MIPVVKERELITSENTNPVDFGFSKTGAVHIMRMLRDKLYSNKILAVVREYSTNAVDAHIDAGIPDRPIEVTLPGRWGTSAFVVRDFGPGLSEQEMEETFIQFGESTKRGSNSQLGMFGIGCKSGFSVTDTFTVTSWHGGHKSVYLMALDERDAATMRVFSREPCAAGETGLAVTIPVDDDGYRYRDEAEKLYGCFEVAPKTNTLPPKPPWDVAVGALGGHTRTYGRKTYVIMGGVPYPMTEANRPDCLPNAYAVWLRVPVGTVTVTPDRERLEETPETVQAVKEYAAVYCLEANRKFAAKLAACANDWEKHEVIRNSKGAFIAPPFSPYADLMSSATHKIEVESSRGRAAGSYGQAVQKETVIVLNPNRIPFNRIDFTPYQHPVVLSPARTAHMLHPSGATDEASFRAAVDLYLADMNCTGIPIVGFDSVAMLPKKMWPGKSPTNKYFKLNPAQLQTTMKKPSSAWEPVAWEDVPDDAVWTQLDRYSSPGVIKLMRLRSAAPTAAADAPEIYGVRGRVTRGMKGQTLEAWVTATTEQLLASHAEEIRWGLMQVHRAPTIPRELRVLYPPEHIIPRIRRAQTSSFTNRLRALVVLVLERDPPKAEVLEWPAHYPAISHMWIKSDGHSVAIWKKIFDFLDEEEAKRVASEEEE